jgi:hypothetical protein
LQAAPAACEQCEPTFTEGAQAAKQGVVGAGIDVEDVPGGLTGVCTPMPAPS